jgi:hypothetical protein
MVTAHDDDWQNVLCPGEKDISSFKGKPFLLSHFENNHTNEKVD